MSPGLSLLCALSAQVVNGGTATITASNNVAPRQPQLDLTLLPLLCLYADIIQLSQLQN